MAAQTCRFQPMWGSGALRIQVWFLFNVSQNGITGGGAVMRLRTIVFLLTILRCSAWGQTYTISTFAGGGLPVNIPGTSASLATTYPIDSGRSGRQRVFRGSELRPATGPHNRRLDLWSRETDGRLQRRQRPGPPAPSWRIAGGIAGDTERQPTSPTDITTASARSRTGDHHRGGKRRTQDSAAITAGHQRPVGSRWRPRRGLCRQPLHRRVS